MLRYLLKRILSSHSNPQYHLRRETNSSRRAASSFIESLEPRQLLSTTLWQGAVSGDWNTPANWVTGQLPTSSDTATLNDSSSTTAITLSSNVVVDTIAYLSGSPAYTISNQQFDIKSIVIQSGVATNQIIDTQLKGWGNLNVTNAGTGTLLLNNFINTGSDNEWIKTHAIDAQGDVTFRGSVNTDGRTFTVVKTGSGTLRYESVFDFNLGKKTDGSVEQSQFIVTAGTLDIASMTLRFESNTNSNAPDPVDLDQDSYVLVNYAGGALIADNDNVFASVENLPQGFEIYHDTANQQVLLRQITSIPGQWEGDVDGNWQTAANWFNDTIPGSGDTASFGSQSQTSTITLSANTALANVHFLTGAISHLIDGASLGITTGITVDQDVTTDQQINSQIKVWGNWDIQHNGNGNLVLTDIINPGTDNEWGTTHTIDTDANVTIKGDVTTGGRTIQVVKSGTGTLSYQGIFDFNLGLKTNGELEQSLFTVTDGTLDLSQMTLNFDSNTGGDTVDPQALTQDRYVLVDYAAGGNIQVNGSTIFGAVIDLPDGYQIIHDTSNQQIILEKSAGGIYVMVGGSGDGSAADSPLNVANMTELEAVWNNMAPGQTLFLINSPQLQNASFWNTPMNLTTGGDVVNGIVRYKSLVGVADSNGNLPTLVSTWYLGNPTSWRGGIIVENGATHIKIENLNMSNVGFGIRLDNTAKTPGVQVDWDVHISNVHITATREGFLIDGGAGGIDHQGSTNVTITDCSIVGFEKRGVTITDGIEQITLTNVLADMGGSAWALEPFGKGFEVSVVDSSNAPNRHVYFVDCTAQNVYHDNGTKYWNGDGFNVEEVNEYIYFYGTKSYNNTDGGYDVKSNHTYFVNTVAIGNSNNYRLWGNIDVVMDNILSAWSYHWKTSTPGGVGIWLADDAVVSVNRATIHNTNQAVSIHNGGTAGLTQLYLTHSIISNTTTPNYDWTSGTYFSDPARINWSSTDVKLYGKTNDPLTNTLIDPLYIDADDADETDGDGRYFANGITYWQPIDDAFDAQDSAYNGLGFNNNVVLPELPDS